MIFDESYTACATLYLTKTADTYIVNNVYISAVFVSTHTLKNVVSTLLQSQCFGGLIVD